MQRETDTEFQHRMLDTMRGIGFMIPASVRIVEGKWQRVADGPDDSGKAGAYKFDRARNGNLVCSYRSFRRDVPAEYKKGDLAYEFARGAFEKSPGIDPPAIPQQPQSLEERLALTPEQRQEMDHAVAAARSEWRSGSTIKAGGHPYLACPELDGSGLRQTSAGALIVPVFRPSQDLHQVEWGGGQRINPDGGKYFITGTKSRCGFSLVPAVSNPNQWMEHLKASPKPLILCEGAGTALAIYQATGYPVIACLSARNLPVVAEWVREAGYSAGRDVVVFGDNDLENMKHPDSGYIGIREAAKAAEILGGRVAIVNNEVPRYDARDLVRDQGFSAVSEQIRHSVFPAELRHERPDAFRFEKEQGKDQEMPSPGMER